MRSSVPFLALAVLLAACGRKAEEARDGSVQRGIDRSVNDIRAAETAAAAPVVESKTISELNGKVPEPQVAAKSPAKKPGESDD